MVTGFQWDRCMNFQDLLGNFWQWLQDFQVQIDLETSNFVSKEFIKMIAYVYMGNSVINTQSQLWVMRDEKSLGSQA